MLRKLSLALLIAVALAHPAYAAPAPSGKGTSAGNPQSIDLNEQGVKAIEAKNFSQAEDLFRRSLAADSKNLTAAFNLAGVYLTQKKPQEAIALLKEYSKVQSQDAGILVRLGDAYFSSKDIPNALSSYEKAYKIAPKYSFLASKLGTTYLLRNNTKDAEKMFRAAVDQAPKDWQLLSNLSSVYLSNGKTQEAIGAAKRALQIKTTPELYVTLGNAYESAKDLKNSLIAFERAKDLGYAGDDLPKKIESLKTKVPS